MTSVFESKFTYDNRPYSNKELYNIRSTFFNNLHIGNTLAKHPRCKHTYLVKSKGQKELSILNNNEDIGKCSVCWKLKKTPVEFKDQAYNLVRNFNENFDLFESKPDIFLFDLESSYYKWLYIDFN